MFAIMIISFRGLRDDLTCILDEELSSMSLCALHCEMRNTQQLLKSIGLLAYEIGSLEDCNRNFLNMVQLISRQIASQSS